MPPERVQPALQGADLLVELRYGHSCCGIPQCGAAWPSIHVIAQAMGTPNYGHAVYAGSFDPVTLGHTAIIERAALLYDKVTVAIGVNVSKQSLFTLEERKAQIRDALKAQPNIEVESFEGLLVDYARDIGAGVIVRGLRMLTDFELEFQLALANRDLAETIETVFLMTNAEFVYVSSSLIKEIASNGGAFERYVPTAVAEALLGKYPRD